MGPEGTQVEAATAAATKPFEGLGSGYPEDADDSSVHHLKLAKLMGWWGRELHGGGQLVQRGAGGAFGSLLTGGWRQHHLQPQQLQLRG